MIYLIKSGKQLTSYFTGLDPDFSNARIQLL